MFDLYYDNVLPVDQVRVRLFDAKKVKFFDGFTVHQGWNYGFVQGVLNGKDINISVVWNTKIHAFYETVEHTKANGKVIKQRLEHRFIVLNFLQKGNWEAVKILEEEFTELFDEITFRKENFETRRGNNTRYVGNTKVKRATGVDIEEARLQLNPNARRALYAPKIKTLQQYKTNAPRKCTAIEADYEQGRREVGEHSSLHFQPPLEPVSTRASYVNNEQYEQQLSNDMAHFMSMAVK